MKDVLKYGLIAVGGYMGFQWLQGQQPEPAAPATNTGGGVQPGVQPGQAPSSTPSTPSTPVNTTPPAQAPPANPQMIYGVSVSELSAKLNGAPSNFWQWNWAMQQIRPDWPMPDAQPFFAGSSDAEIGAFLMTAQQYFNKLSEAGW